MPEISRFFGIVIRMFLTGHVPPHFHAFYGSSKARIRVAPVAVLDSMRLTVEWATLHEPELLDNWRLLRIREAPRMIQPLE